MKNISEKRKAESATSRHALHGLAVPAAVLRALQKRGIYCTPGVTLEHQHLAKRYVLRSVESGGAVSDMGRACAFVSPDGEPNAMTAAESQAFKRSCVCFGLGRYLYTLAEMWVPLNEHRQPFEFPSLPQWALPKASAAGKNHPASGPHRTSVQRGPIDQRIIGKIEGFRRILGDPIYGEILWRVARARKANAIPNAQLQVNVAEAMERAARGIRKAHSLAESIGDTQFVSVLDRLQIGSMTTIRNLEALRNLVSELEGPAGQPAA